MKIKGYIDDLILSAMTAGLKRSKFLWWVEKKDPTSFQELLKQAKKYANAEELTMT